MTGFSTVKINLENSLFIYCIVRVVLVFHGVFKEKTNLLRSLINLSPPLSLPVSLVVFKIFLIVRNIFTFSLVVGTGIVFNWSSLRRMIPDH